jgi:hypothetical protein
MTTRRERFLLVFIAVLFVGLGILYSVTVPVFEAPDEFHHYFYIQHLIENNSLPVQQPAADQPWAQEGSQPPLYYLLAAQLIRQLDVHVVRIDTRDAPALLWLNQHANMGVPLWPANKNRIVHLPRERWPYEGTVLAIHVVRWFSVLLGLGTLLGAYRIGRELLKDRPNIVLGATALVAFTPQFVFISAAISNDNLINFLATLALLLLLRHLQNRATLRTTIALGLVVGAAALSKLSGLFLLPLSAIILLARGWRENNWTRACLRLGIVGGLSLLVAGWWYWRNWQLYGDLTGLNMMLQIVGARLPSPTLAGLRSEFQGLRISYWGLFGWFNVPMDTWIYRALDVASLIAAAGLIWGIVRRRRSEWPAELWLLALPASWLTIVLAALVRWTSLTPGTQGRLLFPAIAAGSLLFAIGWCQWVQRPARTLWMGLLATALFVLTLVAPFRWILPAYQRPPVITQADIPAAARLPVVDHGGLIRFLGAEMDRTSAHPGDIIWITVYWQGLKAFDRDYTVFVHLLDPDGRLVGQTNTWPGLGSLPTRALRPGVIIQDRYPVLIDPAAPAPLIVQADVGLFYEPTGAGLEAVDLNGHDTTTLVGSLRLLPWYTDNLRPTQPLRATLGVTAAQTTSPIGQMSATSAITETGQATLLGYDLTPPPSAGRLMRRVDAKALDLTLYWQADRRLLGDYHVLVHLVHDSGVTVAQADKQPRAGDWPTWAWEPGQTVTDTYRLLLPASAPPGEYTIYVGLYRLSDFARLPISDAQAAVLDNALGLVTFKLTD